MDANGHEITIGCKVRHLHKPLSNDEKLDPRSCPERWHQFFGVSEVTGIFGGAVQVRATNRQHIPVHLPTLLVVVE